MKPIIFFLLIFSLSTSRNNENISLNAWKKTPNSLISYRLDFTKFGWNMITFRNDDKEKIKFKAEVMYLKTGERFFFNFNLKPNSVSSVFIYPYFTNCPESAERDQFREYYFVEKFDVQISRVEILD